MNFVGEFQDIEGRNFTLTIYAEDLSGDNVRLSMGGDPFVTEMDVDDELIYKPVKCQSATIGLMSEGSDYLFELYTNNPTARPVVLRDNLRRIVWKGYITPSLYDIGFEADLEELSVDCIDGLSMLQYIPYTPVGESAGSVTFNDAIAHLMEIAGYAKYYLSKPYLITDIWSCQFSESQFILDEKTCKDVLEEICRFCCVSAVAYGDAVYFVCYDTIPIRYAGYWDTGLINQTNIIELGTIGSGDYEYSAAGQRISLTPVYKKVTVKPQPSEVGSFFGDFFEDAQNVTSSFYLSRDDNTHYGTKIFDTEDGIMEVFLMTASTSSSDDASIAAGSRKLIFVKYYKSKNMSSALKERQWVDDWVDYDIVFRGMSEPISQNMAGAIVCRFCTVDFSTKSELSGYTWRDNPVPQVDLQCAKDFAKYLNFSSVEWSEYVMLLLGNVYTLTGNETTTEVLAKNLLTFETPGNVTFAYGSDDNYILISGRVFIHHLTSYPVPFNDGDINPHRGYYPLTASYYSLTCSLQCGGLYWTGSAWSSTPSTFLLPYTANTTDRIDNVFFKSVAVINTVNFFDGIDKQGYAVPLPQTGIATPPIFRIHGHEVNPYYVPKVIFLEDFKVSLETADHTFGDKDNDEPIDYVAVIDDTSVAELADIELAIHTHHPTLGTSYGDVVKVSGGTVSFVRDLYSVVGGTKVQEQRIADLIANQYKEPRIILEATLTNAPPPYAAITEPILGKEMIVDAVSGNYRDGEFKVRLVEKSRWQNS